MNANELADLYDAPYEFPEWGSKAQAMLRQQALEIQALHQILGYEGFEVGQDYLDGCVIELRKAQEK